MSSIGWGLPDVAEGSTDGTIEYLTLRDLLALVKALNVGPVRDLGLLDSAAHRPRSSFAGRQAYPTVQAKAAALMHSVVCNHALVDGNKRLGLLATAVFLRINGLDLDLDDDEAFELTMSVAAGQLSADDIEKRLRTHPGLKSGRSHRGR
jgi:death-on-curing protein